MSYNVQTIGEPEFINITSVSPFISKCEIKILYLDKNRNRTSLSKDVVTKLAQTLPGCPIVGQYLSDEEDFTDHASEIQIQNGKIVHHRLTQPYGFIDLKPKVWFQDFEEYDEATDSYVVRTYLMTNGYLWTELYQEAKRILTDGNNQSMELDEGSLKGYWSKDKQTGIDFYIITDAAFLNLCILGENVEPCYENACITAPSVSTTFSKNNSDISKTLYSMMNELKEYITKSETKMEENTILENQVTENTNNNSESVVPESVSTVVEPEVEQSTESAESVSTSENSTTNTAVEHEDNMMDEVNRITNEYELLKSKYDDLMTKYNSLKEENQSLYNFKKTIESKEKDELINSFYMLSDEDKKDVIENKEQYSLNDIKAKLSIICVDKKVSFAEHDSSNNVEKGVVTYSINNTSDDENVPTWLKPVKDVKNRNK